MDEVLCTKVNRNKRETVNYREKRKVRFVLKKHLTKSKKRKLASVVLERGTRFEIVVLRKVHKQRRRKKSTKKEKPEGEIGLSNIYQSMTAKGGSQNIHERRGEKKHARADAAMGVTTIGSYNFKEREYEEILVNNTRVRHVAVGTGILVTVK